MTDPDLLAENERLRSKVADLRDIAVDAGVERDQALATLKAVRKVHAEYFDLDVDPAHPDANPEPEDVWRFNRDLRRILDATDGGADCCHTKHGGPVNPDACHRCYVETRHVRDGGDSDE